MKSLLFLDRMAVLALLALPTQAIGAQRSNATQTPPLVIAAEPFFDTNRGLPSDSVVLFQPSGMTRLPDGRVVVGDYPVPGVRIFAPDGQLLKTIGRRGAGPKEFQLASVIGTCGTDSILVHDGANSRYAFVSLDGDVTGVRNLAGIPVTIACNRTRMVAESRATALRVPDEQIAHRGQERLSVRAFGGGGWSVPNLRRHCGFIRCASLFVLREGTAAREVGL